MFKLIKSKRAKELPFEWTAINYPNSIADSIYKSKTSISLKTVEGLLRIPKFLLKCINLVELDLRGNRITTIENLENCKKLERINLANNYLTTLDGLELNTALILVNTWNCFITDKKAQNLLDKLPNVQIVR